MEFFQLLYASEIDGELFTEVLETSTNKETIRQALKKEKDEELEDCGKYIHKYKVRSSDDMFEIEDKFGSSHKLWQVTQQHIKIKIND